MNDNGKTQVMGNQNQVHDLFGFDQALNIMKSGGFVSREGWHKKDMFIGIARLVNKNSIEFIRSKDSGVAYKIPTEKTGDFFVMYTGADQYWGIKDPSPYIIGWLASQADLLAKDWFVVA